MNSSLAFLEVDGIPFYHKTKLPLFLVISSVILLQNDADSERSLGKLSSFETSRRWAMRCLMVHQQFLSEPSNSLKSSLGTSLFWNDSKTIYWSVFIGQTEWLIRLDSILKKRSIQQTSPLQSTKWKITWNFGWNCVKCTITMSNRERSIIQEVVIFMFFNFDMF